MFFQVDGDSDSPHVVKELRRCLHREITALRRERAVTKINENDSQGTRLKRNRMTTCFCFSPSHVCFPPSFAIPHSAIVVNWEEEFPRALMLAKVKNDSDEAPIAEKLAYLEEQESYFIEQENRSRFYGRHF